LDQAGLRYQVIDAEGTVREALTWPVPVPAVEQWNVLPAGRSAAPISGGPFADRLVGFRFRGRSAAAEDGSAQTLLCAGDAGHQPPLWIGLRGREQRLAAIIGPQPRRSPHYWHGPALRPLEEFDVTLLLHTGMGPGGILSRERDDQRWSSLAAASPWGAERMCWPRSWTVGHARRGPNDQPFRGASLTTEAFVGEAASERRPEVALHRAAP
jgi:hypothetical protein